MRRGNQSVGIYVAALAVVLAVLTVIGCGGSEGDERLPTASIRRSASTSATTTPPCTSASWSVALTSQSLVELAIVCDEFGEIVNDLAVRLEPLDPPAEMTTSRIGLVEGLQELSAFLHDFAEIQTLPAARAGSLSATPSATAASIPRWCQQRRSTKRSRRSRRSRP